MIKRHHPFIVLLMVLLLGACKSEASSVCSPSQKGFSESDLIGIWGARDFTIVIRGDGQYKQIVNVEWQEFKYESDWKPWHVTYSDRGLPYLHLEGFLMCAYWDQIDCRTGKTGIEPFVVDDTKSV
jgi:hypothetical protein